MSRPPLTTVILSNVPSEWIIGIDLQFFNSNSLLKGIKLVNDGIHVIHWAADSSSIRYGIYFRAEEGKVIILYWDEEHEKMLVDDEIGALNVSKEMGKLEQYYSFMVTCPPDDQWPLLTKHLQLRQIDYILPGVKRMMDSVLTSAEENNVLLKAIEKGAQSRGSGDISQDPIVNSIIDQSDEEIRYTPIDLGNTVRPRCTPEQRTHDSLDKSWYLNHLITTHYNGNGNLLLGEWCFSYLNMVIFANYSSAMHWLKVLRIMLYCKDVVTDRISLFENFLDLLNLMLDKLPEEYADEFIDEDFFEQSVAEFDYTAKGLGVFKLITKTIDIKTVLLSKFGIDVQLEDEEDPVIVDL